VDIQAFVIVVLVGAVAGWLAGLLTKGKGYGFVGNVVVGVVGAVIGGYVFALIGLSASGLVGSIATATVGAVILLTAVKILFKK